MAATLGWAAQIPAQEFKKPPSVRLPGIYHVWKDEIDPLLPSIDFKAISRCIGNDVALRTRAQDLESNLARLQSELDEFKTSSTAIDLSGTALTQDRAAHDRRLVSLESSDRALKELAATMNQMKSQGAMSTAEVQQYNALVDRYNADVNQRNAQLAGVRRSEDALNANVDAHNARIDEYQRRAADFKQRNHAFLASAKQFEADTQQYNAGCTGERRID